MSKTAAPGDSTLGDELLEGAAEIADYMGLGLRRTFYLLEKGALPAAKLGGRYISTKTKLRERIEGLLAGSG